MKIFNHAFLMVVLIATACTTNKSESANEWPELDAFHEVMAAAWHPVADSSNFEPARTNAAAMEQQAKVWLGAPIPNGLDKEATAARLKALLDSCGSFKLAVEAGRPDSLLKPSLARLHHMFHGLQESWDEAGEEPKH
ncbi:MAG: hypothetical protein ACKOYP_15040 [Bacteroidota bacterium]